MADVTARELKLIQYLNEAYGKEKQLEANLPLQIKVVTRQNVKKRLQDHLKETREQARNIEKRIKALGGATETSHAPGPEFVAEAVGTVTSLANKAMAAAKGPVQAMRGTSKADLELRNLRDAYWNEAEEIAHYIVIEALADELGDKETVKLAQQHRKQEERMQSFLDKQLPQIVKQVVKEEIPAKERQPSDAGSSRRSSSSSRSRSSSSRSSSSRSSSRSSSNGRKSSSRSGSGSKSGAGSGKS